MPHTPQAVIEGRALARQALHDAIGRLQDHATDSAAHRHAAEHLIGLLDLVPPPAEVTIRLEQGELGISEASPEGP